MKGKDTGAGQEARTAEKMEKCWEMRLAGATFKQIGNELGCSHVYALKLYRKCLEERSDRIREMADKYLAHQMDQFDKIILAHWARRGDPVHAGVIMRAMDSKAKLLGLNAAITIEAKHEHTHESEQERATRLMQDAAEEIAQMTPEQVAAEAAALARAD